jgi:NADPH2:quinone reductase
MKRAGCARNQPAAMPPSGVAIARLRIINPLNSGIARAVWRTLRDVAAPTVGPMDLLVRVHAAGLNFADLYRTAAHYGSGDGPPVAAIAGLEMAGEIVGMGSGVTGFALGDRVMAMAGGAYAEYCKVDHRIALRVPALLGWHEAAATSVAFMTAHDALATAGALQAGETLVVQAASSTIGLAAMQIARLLGAGKIIATTSSADKVERLRDLGADLVIDRKEADFAQAVLKATGGHGADVIIENIGGETLPGDIQCSAVGARIVNVGRLGDWNATIDLNEHSRKRIKLIGVTFRTRSFEEPAEVARACERALGDALALGTLRPLIDRAFPLADASAAQDYLRTPGHFGKVVLDV